MKIGQKKKNRQKMVLGKKKIGKKVWSVKKNRQKLLVGKKYYSLSENFLPTFFFTDKVRNLTLTWEKSLKTKRFYKEL